MVDELLDDVRRSRWRVAAEPGNIPTHEESETEREEEQEGEVDANVDNSMDDEGISLLRD